MSSRDNPIIRTGWAVKIYRVGSLLNYNCYQIIYFYIILLVQLRLYPETSGHRDSTV